MIRRYWFNIYYPDDNYTNKLMQIGENEIAYWANRCRTYGTEWYIPKTTKEDLAQTFRLHIWTQITKGMYDPRLSSFRTWCSRVLRNKVISMKRTVDKKNKDVMHSGVFPLPEDDEDIDFN